MESPWHNPNDDLLESFRGRTIEQMSRQELIAALTWAANEIRSLHRMHERYANVMAEIRGAR